MSAWVTALSTYSSTREKVLEHRFVYDVTAELWRRGSFDFAVSRSEVDSSGYDLIVEANRIVRHIQLKAMQVGGKRRAFDLQTRLADKPSAAAVLMLHHPVTLAIAQYRIFAGAPGERVPSLGSKPVRATKGDATGHKAVKPAFRAVSIASFVPVPDVPALVDRLFGATHDLAAVFG